MSGRRITRPNTESTPRDGVSGPRIVWSRHPATRFRTTPRSLVLMPPGSTVVRVEGPAIECWALLASPSTLEELVQTVAERHEVPPGAVEDDIVRAMESLRELGAVRCL